MVVGDGQKFPSVLIVPAFDDLRGWCKRNGLDCTGPNDELIKNEKIISMYEDLVKKYNQGFAQWEQVKKVALLPQQWTVETGEMTPTMKVKRKVIFQNNTDLIDSLYHTDSRR
jgi:long-chain acyl-CoA synthetase